MFENITFTDSESTGIEDKDRAFIKKYRKPVSGLHSLTLAIVAIVPSPQMELEIDHSNLVFPSHARVSKNIADATPSVVLVSASLGMPQSNSCPMTA